MKYLKEYNNFNTIFYHGTISKIPFEIFYEGCDGSGIVNPSKQKFGGFFFTSSEENAEYYSDYFICKCFVENIKITNEKFPNMKISIKDKQNYLYKDVLDGSCFSDVLTVPMCNLNNITILEWMFVGDEEYYFNSLDKLFGDEEGFVNKDMICDILETCKININYLLNITVFKTYFESK